MSVFLTRIQDPSHVAEARRNARRMAENLGFDEETAERVAIVVTEACTNLLKHAKDGELVVRPVSEPAIPGGSAPRVEQHFIEILALDRGPGMADLAACLEDGHSTTGTAGSGLGAIGRLSSFTEIYSRPGRGTALLARISAAAGTVLSPGSTGAVQVPKPGEDVCGDQWAMTAGGERRKFMLADGLGHGTDAARASLAAVDILHRHPDLSVTDTLAAVHDALRPTRGAAVSIAEIDTDRGIVVFAGLGNVSGVVFGGGPPRRMVSINGTAGVEARHIREFTYPWPDGATLVLHSDGIGTHWDLSDYPGVGSHDPSIVAGVVYRDYARGNDDATIVVAR